jgi:hypothetical protein
MRTIGIAIALCVGALMVQKNAAVSTESPASGGASARECHGEG